MKAYYVTAYSPRNCESIQVAIWATSIDNAQDKFFDYLKKLDLYKHMWNLNVDFEEIKDILE